MQPFINRPFIINITPHPHITPSHIITLTLPTLKPSISLIHSHFFFILIIHHENSQIHLKQEAEQENTQILSTDTPSLSTMHAGSKRPNETPKGSSSSKPTKRAKEIDPNSAKEISKEMTVGFGLDKYWYDSTPFPQLHAIF